jgi:tRNA G37 N-methylase TrmD
MKPEPAKLTVKIITLFPEMFPGHLGLSLSGKALEKRIWSLETINPRYYTTDVGDYVLSGGEQAAMILLDSVIRLLPDVIGNAGTHDEESFGNGLLEYPHYTRPAEWTGPDGILRKVPEILSSGHHAKVKEWRLEQSKAVTKERRPDLWSAYVVQNPDNSKKTK